MKLHTLLSAVLCLLLLQGNAQTTNTFPATGNVGIGTVDPLRMLDIRTNASQAFGLSISPGGNNHSYLLINRRSGYDGGILWSKDGSYAWQQVNSDNGDMCWYSYGKSGGGNTVLIFNKEGDIGIGTLTPSEKLSVNGKIRAQEIKVETANWPDYVFSEGYKPYSLFELEDFIRINKHLPEIPTAREAEAGGISLGEMNAKLLKKIEELTLYLIEQNKQIQEQNKRIEQLEKNEK